jgi:hypothetical protein
MMPTNLSALLSWGVIVFSGTAALFWAIAAFSWVNAQITDKPDKESWYAARVTDAGTDVIASARRQTFWNRFAAGSACLAALCQMVLAYKYGKL